MHVKGDSISDTKGNHVEAACREETREKLDGMETVPATQPTVVGPKRNNDQSSYRPEDFNFEPVFHPEAASSSTATTYRISEGEPSSVGETTSVTRPLGRCSGLVPNQSMDGKQLEAASGLPCSTELNNTWRSSGCHDLGDSITPPRGSRVQGVPMTAELWATSTPQPWVDEATNIVTTISTPPGGRGKLQGSSRCLSTYQSHQPMDSTWASRMAPLLCTADRRSSHHSRRRQTCLCQTRKKMPAVHTGQRQSLEDGSKGSDQRRHFHHPLKNPDQCGWRLCRPTQSTLRHRDPLSASAVQGHPPDSAADFREPPRAGVLRLR